MAVVKRNGQLSITIVNSLFKAVFNAASTQAFKVVNAWVSKATNT